MIIDLGTTGSHASVCRGDGVALIPDAPGEVLTPSLDQG